jgi:hypothetical protein
VEVCLLLGTAHPSRLTSLLAALRALGSDPVTCLWKLEIRNWKLDVRNRKLEIGNWTRALGFQFPVSSLAFSVTPKVRGDGRKKKNVTNEATMLLKTKETRTN